MRSRLVRLLNLLRYSYWFIPAVMAVGAIAASVVMVSIDKFVGAGLIDDIHWLYANHPEGARVLLSTIAGSMITVAGVTFSISIAAVASSTIQFGPRLLTSFLNDRGNQLTLGTFIATFLYCLLILRTVMIGGEDSQDFVPNIAILFALLLALASVGFLIYFLHHVPLSVHISHMIARVGRALIQEVDTLFPDEIGDPAEESGTYDLEALERSFETAFPVPAEGFGYIQQVDGDELIEAAAAHQVVIRVDSRPGTFVRHDLPLAMVRSQSAPDEALIKRIRGAFSWDVKRSPSQDVMFLVDQLVEIAARALSPGVNDPFTAMNSLEWLTSALAEIATRRNPDARRFDDQGELRLIARPILFADFADAAFASLRPYISRDRNASAHAMRKLASLAGSLTSDDQRMVIGNLAAEYLSACERSLEHPADRTEIAKLYDVVQSRCATNPG